jgi:uncharacterized low-complexity protein
MNKKTHRNTVSLAIGAALASGLAAAPVVHADVNPFALSALSGGYMVASGMTGEGQCGATKKSSEAKCGAEKAVQKITKEGECGAKTAAKPKPVKEAKCGEAKCGNNK